MEGSVGQTFYVGTASGELAFETLVAAIEVVHPVHHRVTSGGEAGQHQRNRSPQVGRHYLRRRQRVDAEAKRLAGLGATRKASSLVEEFKKFAFKGNVVDLAIGVIIGAAFGTIVKSLVDDIIMPLIGLILPGALKIAPVLVPLAAVGLVLIMIGAAVTHARRRESPMVVFNLILLVLAAIVAWGRFGPYTISS